MAGSYNKVLLMGNLTRDVELRQAGSSGTMVANIGLAVNRKWRDQNSNEWKEEVTYIDCEAWGKTAETMSKYLVKGRPVFIEGRLRLDQWEDKDGGGKRSKLKVVVEEFRFIDSREGGGGVGAGGGDSPGAPRYSSPPRGQAPVRGAAASAPPPEETIQDEDIPF